MPIPIPTSTNSEENISLFPTLSRENVDAARTSSWYDLFEDITIPCRIIDLREIGEQDDFIHWLESDSIFLPENSEGLHDPSTSDAQTPSSTSTSRSTSTATSSSPSPSPQSRSSSPGDATSNTDSDSDSETSIAPIYRLPKLNAAIRSALRTYEGSVFPKLNWSSPKDAACLLPQTARGPLHCTSPSDIYLLLKSSDFISFDLDPQRAYEGVSSDNHNGESSSEEENEEIGYELVLKKYEDINPSREIRCFVRNKILIGITQRDVNYYDHLQSEHTRVKICDTVRSFWEDEIRENYQGGDDYVFDLYLSANLTTAKIIDFQPYRPSTDPLLFTYEELLEILLNLNTNEERERPRLPIFKYIDSPSHPSTTRNAPSYQSSMLPLEMIEFSQGRSMQEFKEAWEEAVAAGMTE